MDCTNIRPLAISLLPCNNDFFGGRFGYYGRMELWELISQKMCFRALQNKWGWVAVDSSLFSTVEWTLIGSSSLVKLERLIQMYHIM